MSQVCTDTTSAPAIVPRSGAANRGHYSVVLARTEAESLVHVPAWQALARQAVEPNPFFEPWFLLPARRARGEGRLLFAFVYGPPGSASIAPRLDGFFPLAVRDEFKRLPMRVLSLWHHDYCVLGTPLVRAEAARECLTAFLDWAAHGPCRAALVELPYFPADGALARVLDECCRRRRLGRYVQERFDRPLFVPHADDDGPSADRSRWSKRQRKRARQLARLGHVEFRVVEAADEVSRWCELFLGLEASGWKGRAGTALACRDADAVFFREVCAGASALGQLLLAGLFLDGRPIAMKCTLRAGPGAFAFKVAYDERLARYAPGVQLELHRIDWHRCHPEIAWVDSCADPHNAKLGRLWHDRRPLQHRVVSTGGWGGRLLLALLPALRWFKRRLRPRAGAANSVEDAP